MVYVLTFPVHLHHLGMLKGLSVTLLTQYLERSVIHLSQGKARYERYYTDDICECSNACDIYSSSQSIPSSTGEECD